MALRKSHIEKISHAIAKKFAEDKVLAAKEDVVVGRISSLITANMETEHEIDNEAHKLLDKNRKAMGMEIDEQKAFIMIKKQLAKQKNFIL